MKILIAGAGPAGLGAAWRLTERGHTEWSLLEASGIPGGLSASVLDSCGFTWDLGGHVLFSRIPYFNQLMDDLPGSDWTWHQRVSRVWMRDRFIPYPLQNNIWRLPPAEVQKCVLGIKELQSQRSRHKANPSNFEEWILSHYGRGLADVFMIPYNEKVWAYPPAKLEVGWMRDRVSPIDFDLVLRNIELQHDETEWGANARFRYPTRGGMGSVWKELYSRLPPGKVCFHSKVFGIDPRKKELRSIEGARHEYDYLISTMPLDTLVKMVPSECLPDQPIDPLVYSSTHIIGLGFEGRVPLELEKTSWIYFPETDPPFYRVTVLSNYSSFNVPDPTRYWSLLCEVSESPCRPVSSRVVANEVVRAIQKLPFLQGASPLASVWHSRLERGYPVPFLGRDPVLTELDAVLKACGIFSRGRFGGWKYEASNQDHSFMQGVEAVDHILDGKEEFTYYHGGD
jgi:protoporphyrinogen oxidase